MKWSLIIGICISILVNKKSFLVDILYSHHNVNMTRKYKRRIKKNNKSNKSNKSNKKNRNYKKGGEYRKIEIKEHLTSDPLNRNNSARNTDGPFDLVITQIDANPVATMKRLFKETDILLNDLTRQRKDQTYEGITTYTHQPIDADVKTKIEEIRELARDPLTRTDTEKRNKLTRKVEIMKNRIQNLIQAVDPELQQNLKRILDILS